MDRRLFEIEILLECGYEHELTKNGYREDIPLQDLRKIINSTVEKLPKKKRCELGVYAYARKDVTIGRAAEIAQVNYGEMIEELERFGMKQHDVFSRDRFDPKKFKYKK